MLDHTKLTNLQAFVLLEKYMGVVALLPRCQMAAKEAGAGELQDSIDNALDDAAQLLEGHFVIKQQKSGTWLVDTVERPNVPAE